MSAAEDQGWTPSEEAERRRSQKPRFCSECRDWTDHFADEHEDYVVATDRDQRWCSACPGWTTHTSRGHDRAISAQGETG